MSTYSPETAAERAGVGVDEVRRLAELGILPGGVDGGYTDADVRRVQVVEALERDGLPIDALASMVREGRFSLDFVDDAASTVFAALSEVTFAELSDRTGIPVETLIVLRDVTGGTTAAPHHRVREDELEIVPLVQYQLELGFRPRAIERALRVYGDSLRRIAEAEAEWWRSEVQEPMLAGGSPVTDLADRASEISPRLAVASDRAVMAVYHAQQRHVWSTNIVAGIGTALEQAGFYAREARAPAMCFLDITGYTELTAEEGDAAAASMVERLSRIVHPISVEHRGRPVKWLGDGVMFHFPDPGMGVLAACSMVDALAAAGMPPAHVGLHAGPVVVQEGDFYGSTVNLASRIGDFARPGEVLVSREVMEVAHDIDVTYTSVGPVELKGVGSPVELFSVTTGGRMSPGTPPAMLDR